MDHSFRAPNLFGTFGTITSHNIMMRMHSGGDPLSSWPESKRERKRMGTTLCPNLLRCSQWPQMSLLLKALASISYWNHGPWSKLFFVHVFGCHFRSNFHRECGMCLAWLDESWTAVPAPLQHHGTCDRGSQLPWCVQPYSEIHRARGQWPCCCDISGGSSCGPPVLSEDSHLIWYFCYNFIKIPSNKKKLTHCKLWTLTKCEIWKCFCKQVNFFYGKNNLLCTMPQNWYFLNWGKICNFFWNWQMKLKTCLLCTTCCFGRCSHRGMTDLHQHPHVFSQFWLSAVLSHSQCFQRLQRNLHWSKQEQSYLATVQDGETLLFSATENCCSQL